MLSSSIIILISLIIGTIFCMSVFFINNLTGFITLLTIGQLSLFFITGPINSIFMWTVENNLYSTNLNNELKSLACAISTMFIHLFGDVPSPILFGVIQDLFNNWNISIIILTSFLLISILFMIPQYIFTKKKIKNIPLLSL